MPTKYEVTNKETGEKFAVTQLNFGQEEVTVKAGEQEITFSNIGRQGDLQNDTWTISEVKEETPESTEEVA